MKLRMPAFDKTHARVVDGGNVVTRADTDVQADLRELAWIDCTRANR